MRRVKCNTRIHQLAQL